MQGFWKHWMIAWFVFGMAFAIVLALAAWPPADGITRPILGLIAGDAHPSSIFDPMPMRFAIGLQGALSLGWLLTMMIAMRAADRLAHFQQKWRGGFVPENAPIQSSRASDPTKSGLDFVDDAQGAQIWREITAAISVWYVVDCAISLGTGFPLNAVSNTILIIGYLIPVLGSGVLSRA